MDIKAWLSGQMVDAAAYDADELLESFLDEMKRGLSGEESSLAMIPAYVGTTGLIPLDQTVAVIDAGGTHLRIGLARFGHSGGMELTALSKQPMPGRDHEVSAAEFYRVLVDALEPLSNQFDHIGFCFSYPAEILSNHDGRLLHWTKEIKIPELVGTHIGAGLIKALDDRGIKSKKVVVLNDTVATLLAGLSKGQAFNASSYVGFILGTGTNTAYVERNENIEKLAGQHADGSQVINVESGGFSRFMRGPFDAQLDCKSENPGRHIFEKLLSGVYMGSITLELLQAMSVSDALSELGRKKVNAMTDLSTIPVDNLVAGNGLDIGNLGSPDFSDRDRDVIKTVFNVVVERAAHLTAINILAAVLKTGEGHNPDRTVCVNIDGSTYYKTFGMKDRVQSILLDLLNKKKLHLRCVHVEDAPVAGAAIAALTTF